MKIGDKFKFDAEAQRYTVRACNDRFTVMTKPFNARKTYLYTITDNERGERGPCDLIFGPPCDLDNSDGAAEALAMLASGEMAVSYRRGIPLTEGETKLLLPADQIANAA